MSERGINRGNVPKRSQIPTGITRVRGLRPRGSDVLVIRDKPDETLGSGLIYVPDSARERKITGRVAEVGPQVEEDLKPGTRVMITKFGAVDFTVDQDGETLNLMVVDDRGICLVLDDDDIELEEDL